MRLCGARRLMPRALRSRSTVVGLVAVGSLGCSLVLRGIPGSRRWRRTWVGLCLGHAWLLRLGRAVLRWYGLRRELSER